MGAVSAYIGRRLAIAVPLLWVVSVVSYLLLYRAADPVARLRQDPRGPARATSPAWSSSRASTPPGIEGYWRWLSGFVRGDWGLSATNGGAGALETIMDALPATLELMGLALLVSAVLGVAFGVVSATRPGSGADLALTGAAYLGFATPTFLAGVLLQLGAIWMRDEGWAIVPVRDRHDPPARGARPHAPRRRGDRRGARRRGGADRAGGGPLGEPRRRREHDPLHRPALLVRARGRAPLAEPPPAPRAARAHAVAGQRRRLEPLPAGRADRGAALGARRGGPGARSLGAPRRDRPRPAQLPGARS